MTGTAAGYPARTALHWREWRRMWLVQAVKWLAFLPVVALWLAAAPLKLAADWTADRLNSAYVNAYNADMRRAHGRQPRRPGAARDGEL
jgi:hypothetical protein